jgi:RHS repeat-associated protein
LPPAYSAIAINYVRTWEAVKPETNPNNITTAALPQEFRMATAYIDGLGRNIQTVLKQGSMISGSNPVDLVSTVLYDEFGREQFKYLPFAANNTGGNTSVSDGLFKLNPFHQQEVFSQNQYPGEQFYYGQTQFEASPLNRPVKVLAPGNSWMGDGRGISMKYWINTTNDAVRIWNVTNGATAWDMATFASPGAYPAGELHKNVSEDEHGKQVIEYKDKEGKVVLKKVQLTASADNGTGSGHGGWICTYYIYDALGLLRGVVQPKAVEEMESASSWSLSTTQMDELCFRYDFDYRGRMIVKKVPGAAPVQMIYDARDRLVMMQDGNLIMQQKWLYTQYDALNRPIASGILLDEDLFDDPGYHRNQAKNSISYPNLANYQTEELTRTFYDDYDWRASYGNPLSASFDNSYNSYYLAASATTFPYPIMPQQSNATKGMVTGIRTKILGTTSQYLYSVNIYDHKGRMIQVQSTNVTNGTDVITTQYSFNGQPLVIVEKQQKGGTTNPLTFVIATKISYDHLGRTNVLEKSINNGGWKTVSQLEYNALGQVKSKKLGTNPANTALPLESLVSEYNIRGWVTGINKEFLSSGSSTSNFFGMELSYDKDGYANNGSKQFNGNIGATTWRSQGDGERRKFDYSYDAANRFLKADFAQLEGSNWTNANVNYNIKMGDGSDPLTAYDANGNIKRMQQWGWKLTGSEQIDDLSYSYFSNSNKLKDVSDARPAQGMGDFTDKNTTATDYGYDLNGNLIADLNKRLNGSTGIDQINGGAISYNHLNLPEQITVKDDNGNARGNITYTYNSLGNKIRKVSVENASSSNGNVQTTTTTTYLGSSVYESRVHSPAQSDDYVDRLQFISFEEGRIRFEPANSNNCPTSADRFVFDYYIKDHLGNVRMMLTEQSENLCYPAATVESSTVAGEKLIYDIVDGRIIDKSSTDATSVSSFNDKLYRTHGGLTNEKTGLGVVLKVMSGDKVFIKVESYYTMPSGGAGSPLSMSLTDLLTSMVGSNAISSVKGALTTSTVTGIGNNNTNLQNFINQSQPSNTPKAYLNWILFDDQLRYVSSGADPVASGGGYKLHDYFISNPVGITKNGFLYAYVSNESNLSVYFDNMQITHTPGPILEENHYYPQGLAMKNISSKGFGKIDNKKKFNSYELNDDFDLGMYESFFRSHDPQLGRFWQVDPKPTDGESLYAAMGNNPIKNFDLLGDTVYSRDEEYDKEILDRTSKALNLKKGQANPINIDGESGLLSLNKKAYKKLTKEQKAILEPLIGMMNNEQNFGINVVDKDYAIKPLDPGRISETDPETGQVFTGKTTEYFGGGVTLAPAHNPELGKKTIEIFLQKQEYTGTVISTSGQKISSPNYVIQFHEIGHGYYKYVVGVPWQGCKAIDAENDVRSNTGLQLRDYDQPTKKDPLPLHRNQ